MEALKRWWERHKSASSLYVLALETSFGMSGVCVVRCDTDVAAQITA